jgi:hypothetical protein
VHDELARWKGREARRCWHAQASKAFTPGTTVEFGPAFTNGRTQQNAKKVFLHHQSTPVHPPGRFSSLLITYKVNHFGDT